MSDAEKLDSEGEVRDDQASAEPAEGEEAAPKLDLMVNVTKHGACQRHVTVTISRQDIDRYFDKEFSDLVGTAQVPGFRPGRAPRKLIEHRFRKDVADKVKTGLLMDAISQISDDEKLSAISEPEFKLDAVVLPERGPMTFEFDLEVRPEFDLPQWKGLKLEKPVHEFNRADVDRALQNLLERRGRLIPFEGPAELGDYISTNLTFKYEDKVLSKASEEVIRIRQVLSFRDGKIEKFGELMQGVQAGDVRELEAQLSNDAPNESLRGKTVTAVFEVLEVKKLEAPELTPAFLDDLGGFESEGDLRDAIGDMLEERLQYHQRRRYREQITNTLTKGADWELPPDLLRRQSHRELQRAVLELQRSGFSEQEVRAHENELRQNSMAMTARALKEHFILERIAEEEKIDATEEDYDAEIATIASQTGQTPRRVRARLEKQGMMDVLRNQVIERKAIDRILEHAEFQEVPYQPEWLATDSEAIEQSAGGEGDQSDIPEAKPESHRAEAEAAAETSPEQTA